MFLRGCLLLRLKKAVAPSAGEIWPKYFSKQQQTDKGFLLGILEANVPSIMICYTIPNQPIISVSHMRSSHHEWTEAGYLGYELEMQLRSANAVPVIPLSDTRKNQEKWRKRSCVKYRENVCYLVRHQPLPLQNGELSLSPTYFTPSSKWKNNQILFPLPSIDWVGWHLESLSPLIKLIWWVFTGCPSGK